MLGSPGFATGQRVTGLLGGGWGGSQRTGSTRAKRPQRLKKIPVFAVASPQGSQSTLPSQLPARCLHLHARAACTLPAPPRPRCLHAARTPMPTLPARCLHPHACAACTLPAPPCPRCLRRCQHPRALAACTLPAPTRPGCPQRCLHPCARAACAPPAPVPCDFGVIYALFSTFSSRGSVPEVSEQGSAAAQPQPGDYF